jgi:hypothetical protein
MATRSRGETVAKKKLTPNPRTTVRPVHKKSMKKKAKKKCAHGGKRKGAGRKPTTGRTTMGRCYTANREEDALILAEAKRDKISIGQVLKRAVRSYYELE